jgi:hypothetical protein
MIMYGYNDKANNLHLNLGIPVHSKYKCFSTLKEYLLLSRRTMQTFCTNRRFPHQPSSCRSLEHFLAKI